MGITQWSNNEICPSDITMSSSYKIFFVIYFEAHTGTKYKQ